MEEARKLGELVGETIVAVKQIEADIRLLRGELDGETQRHNQSVNYIGTQIRKFDERIKKLEEEMVRCLKQSTQTKLV